MINFKKNGNASFMQKRKRELENNNAGLDIEDLSVPLHNRPEEPTAQENENPADNCEGLTENKTEHSVCEDNKPVKGGVEPEKKKVFIRKTVAIEEDVFVQLQLLKAYHRMDHQDIIAVAVREFLRLHTEDGRIKDASLAKIQKMVENLKKP